uniref:Uncharacterized protein n=1 Tax=Musa acuminata subsp. malaccensis TaxID=214687 RepID=A0A804I8K4_MUSAM
MMVFHQLFHMCYVSKNSKNKKLVSID